MIEYVGLIVLALLITNEICQSFYRNYRRGLLYKLAYARALNQNRPLIVIGDPHNGVGSWVHGPAYGAGSLVIDISGCLSNECNVIKQDIISGLAEFESNSCVIFVSCVLEYLEDSHIERALSEINRVAGSFNNIFVVTVGSASLSAYYYQSSNGGAHTDMSRRVFATAPPHGEFAYRNFLKEPQYLLMELPRAV